MGRYSHGLIVAWGIAANEAHAGQAKEISPAHMLIALCKLSDLDVGELRVGSEPIDPELAREVQNDAWRLLAFFRDAGLDQTSFRRRLRAQVQQPHASAVDGGVMHRSTETRRTFQRAEDFSHGASVHGVRPISVLQALFEMPNPPWSGILADMGMSRDFGDLFDEIDPPPDLDAEQERPAQRRRASTPMLDRFGRDLSQSAREGKLSPVIGRRQVLLDLARVLSQERRSNAILVGDPGVGKTCVVEGLAQWLSGPNAPRNLASKRLVEVPIFSIVAGTKYRGEFEQRLEALIAEATSSDDIIIFFDEIHNLLGAGGTEGGNMDAADILKPALGRGDFCCIGATTTSEYGQYIEKDAALERRFQKIWVDEPTRNEAAEIIKGLKSRFEEHHGREIGDNAIEAAVELSMRYLPDLRLPDKAIDLIDQACARGRIITISHHDDLFELQSVSREDIAAVVAERCRLPVERLTEDETQRLLHMEDELRTRVMGQDHALREVSNAVRTARAGLKDQRRPIGVFMFAGATGTGKTELAKALAEFLFIDENRLVRIDMSEYQESHTISRLIGAPPGYVGYEEEGQLTGPVRTNPYSVVLFDEVEKAHPKVLDIFLQIFDEGRLTDSRGRRVSFAETIVIMTSNLGAQAQGPARRIGFDLGGGGAEASGSEHGEYDQRIIEAIRTSLRPELVNRIRNVVVFHPLNESAVRQIIDKILSGLRGMLQDRRIEIRLTPAAYSTLIDRGFDPRFGAREMERTVDRLIVQPLSDAILGGRLPDGTVVDIDARDGELLVGHDPGRTRAVSSQDVTQTDCL